MAASKARRSAASRSAGTSGRREHGAAEFGGRRDQRNGLLLLLGLGELDQQRHVGEAGLLRQALEHQRLELLLGDVVRRRGDDAQPRRAAALDLAALQREVQSGNAVVALDDLELGAVNLVEHLRHDRGRRGAAVGADDDLLLARFLQRLRRRGVPDREHVADRRHQADPAPGVDVVLAGRDRLDELRDHDGLLGHADGRCRRAARCAACGSPPASRRRRRGSASPPRSDCPGYASRASARAGGHTCRSCRRRRRRRTA